MKREDAIAAAGGSRVISPFQELIGVARAAGLQALAIDPVNAGDIARIGWRKIQAGETVTPEQLEANYIRRSDAEILAEPAAGC